jgi:hypothetical protein
MTTSIIRKAVFLTLLLVAVPISHAGVIAIENIALQGFSGGTPQVDSAERTWGWQFKPTESISVDALGSFYFNNSSNSDHHQVGLWTSDSNRDLLATATVRPTSTIQGSGYPNGVFRYTSITPVELTAGKLYVIGMTMGAAPFYVGGSSTLNPVFDPSESGTQRVSGSSPTGDLLYPFTNNADKIGYFGPNFTFEKGLGVAPVPEPSSLAIFGINAVGWITARRRRRRSRPNPRKAVVASKSVFLLIHPPFTTVRFVRS